MDKRTGERPQLFYLLNILNFNAIVLIRMTNVSWIYFY